MSQPLPSLASSDDSFRSHDGGDSLENDDSSNNESGPPDSYSGPGGRAPSGSSSASEPPASEPEPEPEPVVAVAPPKAAGKRKAAAPKQANKRVRKTKNPAPQPDGGGDNDESAVAAAAPPKKPRKRRVNKPKASPPDPNDPDRKRQFAARMQVGERQYNKVLEAMVKLPWLPLGEARAMFGIKSFLPPVKVDPRQLLYWLYEDPSQTIDTTTYKHLFKRLRALSGARYSRLTGVTTSLLKGTDSSSLNRWLHPGVTPTLHFLDLIDKRDRVQLNEIIALDMKALVAEVRESLVTTLMLCELYQLSKNNRLYVDINLVDVTPSLFAMKQRTFGLYQQYRAEFNFHLDLLEAILQQTMQVRSAPSHGKVMPAPPVPRADLSKTTDYPRLMETLETAWAELYDEHALVKACVKLVPTHMQRNTEKGGEVTTHTMLRSWIKQIAELAGIKLARSLVVSSTVYSRVADFISTHFGISVQQKKSLEIHISSETPLLRGRRGNNKAFTGVVFSNSMNRRAEAAVAVATARPVAVIESRPLPRLLESPSQLPDAEVSAPPAPQQQEPPSTGPQDDFELEDPAVAAEGYVMADDDDAY